MTDINLTPGTERLWKVTGPNGEACHGGTFHYDLPKWDKRKGWIPGTWTPRIEKVRACSSGYHICRDRDLLSWCHGARIWAVEARGPLLTLSDKVVAQEIRLLAPTPWDDVTARLFAVDVAATTLPLFEKVRPTDSRVSDCLETAYRFALGEASAHERAAARAAAWDVARDAARDAAWAVAGDAARAAAWAAAGAVARDAAGDAARAAARAAAGAAAWAAAWAVEWDATRDKQTARLMWWLGASDTYPED